MASSNSGIGQQPRFTHRADSDTHKQQPKTQDQQQSARYARMEVAQAQASGVSSGLAKRSTASSQHRDISQPPPLPLTGERTSEQKHSAASLEENSHIVRAVKYHHHDKLIHHNLPLLGTTELTA